MKREADVSIAVAALIAASVFFTLPANAAEVSLKVSRWAGPQADAQRQLLEEYERQTGVKVKLDAIDFGQLKQKQTLNMSTRTGEYDLVYIPESWLGEYTKASFLAPLDAFVKDEKLTGPNWDFQDFSKAALQVYTVGGSLQALPYFVQTPLLVYNKDTLKDAGFAEPKTWDDLLKVATHFKQKGSGIALPFRQGSAIANILAVLVAGNEGSFFDSSGKLAMTQPPVVESVRFMQDLGKQTLRGSNGWHWDEVSKALQFGQAPLGITVSGLFKALENSADSNVAGKLGYAAIPYNKRPVGLIQSWAWAIPGDSKNKEEAFKLAAWLNGKAALAAMSKLDPSFISFRASLASDSELVAKAPWLGTANKVLSNGVTLPLQPAAPQLLDALAAGLSGVVTNGNDPLKTLEQIQASQSGKF